MRSTTALLLLLLLASSWTQPAHTFVVPVARRRPSLQLGARPETVLDVEPEAPSATAAAPFPSTASIVAPPTPPLPTKQLVGPELEDEEDAAALAEAKTVVIRRMTLRDVASAFHLGEHLFSSEKFPQLYRTWSAYEVTDSMSTDPELCLVAEAVVKLPPRRGRPPKGGRKEYERRVVGFVLGSITEKRKASESCGYISWVAVAEDFQRQGIGTQLVGRMEEMFIEEGMRTVVADTPETNMPARCFLEGLGFGSPVSHVYLSLNFATKEQEEASKPRGGGGNKGAQGPRAKVKVRQMEVDDLAKVHELGEEVFTAELPNLFQIWSEAEVIDLFGSDAENCFVAEVEREVVGFCLGTTIEKKHSSWRYGYLVWLAVSRQAQGLGVGKKLLHCFEEAMKEEGCRILLIDTQSDNVAARSFFARGGFKNFEDHRYYTKLLPLKGTQEADTTELKSAAAVEATTAEATTTAAAEKQQQGIPQPRLMRLSKSSKKLANV